MSDELPVVTAISADLRSRWAARRTRLVIVIAMQAATLATAIAMMGPKPDLFARAPWRLAAELFGWGAACIALPAVALGLWHPTATVSTSIAIVAAAAFTIAATGLPGHWDGRGGVVDGCAIMAGLAGAVGLLALAAMGGLSRERARGGAAWLALAVAATGFGASSAVCPRDGAAHVLLGHWAPALVVGAVALIIARSLRRGAVG